MIERLKILPKHIAYFLLKNCLGIPKMMYTLRTVPTFMFSQDLIEMDTALKSSLEDILNLNLSNEQFKQASLPIIHGGIGLRSILDLSLPAFLSSHAGTLPLVSNILNIHVDSLASRFAVDGFEKFLEKFQEVPLNQTVQHEWDKIVIKRRENELEFDNFKDIARLKAIKNREAGAWLQAFPSKNIGMFMNNQSFQVAVGLRLGCELCREYQCICGATIDKKCLHPLSCSKNTGRYYRHSEVNTIIKKALVSADVPAQLEPAGLDRSDGKRPDGTTLIPWKMGKCLVWDFTCIDTYAMSYLNQTKHQAGAAAEAAVKRKHQKYEDIKASGMDLIVVAVETAGVMCEEGRNWIYNVGKRLIDKTGDVKARSYLIQRISMAIQKGNAACVISARPTNEELYSVFYL